MHFSSSYNQPFCNFRKSKKQVILIFFICLLSFSCFSHWWQPNVVDTSNIRVIYRNYCNLTATQLRMKLVLLCILQNTESEIGNRALQGNISICVGQLGNFETSSLRNKISSRLSSLLIRRERQSYSSQHPPLS